MRQIFVQRKNFRLLYDDIAATVHAQTEDVIRYFRYIRQKTREALQQRLVFVRSAHMTLDDEDEVMKDIWQVESQPRKRRRKSTAQPPYSLVLWCIMPVLGSYLFVMRGFGQQ